MTASPRVSLLRHGDYDPASVEKALIRLLEPLGGMQAFVKAGDDVVLKPNIICARAPEDAVTTHPSVVRAAARLALDCGGKVTVGDSPGRGAARKAAHKAGIAQVADELGIEVVEFTPREVAAGPSRGESIVHKLELAGELRDADVIINIPKLKTHCMMLMTMAVKNMFGAVIDLQKFQWHLRAGKDKALFGRVLHEIYRAVPPALSIVDAVVSMDGDGPTAGRPVPTGFLAAGADASSVDAVLMDVVGLPREQLHTLAAAAEAGDTAWQSAEPVGETPEALRPARWVMPESVSAALPLPGIFQRLPFFRDWLRQQTTARPYALRDRCILCGECVAICPADAMEMDERGVVIDDAACIRCYCCHEICPESAMGLRKGFLGRLFAGLAGGLFGGKAGGQAGRAGPHSSS